MASKIVRHEYDGFFISQRIDGFVNLTQIAKVGKKNIADYFKLDGTYEYIKALDEDFFGCDDSRDSSASGLSANDFARLFPRLIAMKRGSSENGGGTWGHSEIAIDMAQWVSTPFRIWANRTLRGVIAKAHTGDFDRVLDFPAPGSPAFEDWFEREVSKVTGLHKNDIRNGKFYWEFVYYWLTEEERAKLNEINPVLPNGRRRYKIHDCLTPETKIRLAPFQLKLMGKLESANSVDELRRMVQRAAGVDQSNLFDGWDWKDEGGKAS